MSPLQLPVHLRSLCLILLWSNLAVLATSPENIRLYIPVESEYTTDDLFAASSPNHVAAGGVAPPDEFMGEEPRAELGGPPTSGLPIVLSGFFSGPFLQGVPLPADPDVSISPSRHPMHPATSYILTHPSSTTTRLPSDETEAGALRGTPRRRIAKQGKAEKNPTRANTRMSELDRVAQLLRSHPFRPSHRSYLTELGEILIPYLRIARLAFKDKLAQLTDPKLDYYAFSGLKKIVHPSLPYGRYKLACSGDNHDCNGLQLLRVLKHDSNPQTDLVLCLHYRNLILFTHKLYEEILENLRIPIVAQVKLQEEFFTWLDKQIFAHTGGYPLLGTIEAPFPIWKADLSDQTLRPAQLQLLMFFSQAKGSLEQLPETASFLLSEFRRETPGPKSSQELAPIRFNIFEPPKETLSILLKLFPPQFDQEKFGSVKAVNDEIVKFITSDFKQQSDRFDTPTGGDEHVHPKLSIAIYESTHLQSTQDSQPLRILRESDSLPLREDQLLILVNRLLIDLDSFHQKIMRYFPEVHNTIQKRETRRKELLHWLVQMMIKPTDSLPVHGLVRTKPDRLPWDNMSPEDSVHLFGPVQRNLIKHFSRDERNRHAYSKHLVLFLATWYMHHHPDELEYGIKIT
ncbi:hypothetical protein PtB15_14B477 [Puccinia triticina]|nr:hypothetical protein PtB15_14B477 [Puccinia triticina]